MNPNVDEVAVRFYGEGPSVLLLHGLAGSGVTWRGAAERMAGYRAVAPDLLGFGDSPKPDVPYDLGTHSDALEGLVREYKPQAIVGHSMGAIIALELLRRHPEIRVGLLVSPAVFADADEAGKAISRHHRVGVLTLPSKPLGHLSCTIMCHLRPVLRPILPLFARDLPADVVRAGLDHNWHSMSRTSERVVWAGLVPALLEKVGERVSVLHGRLDETVPVGQVEPLRGLCRDLRIVDGGHLLPLREPEIVAGALLDRLKST